MAEKTDAKLVALIRRGSRDAAGQLAERYLRGCRAVALAIVEEISAAEDVCQDAFVYAIERIADCREPEKFGGWLLRIVRNKARNHVRDRKDTIHLDGVEVAGNQASPVLETERAELRARLLEALSELPSARREVLLLHDLEGWTHREIAERVDLPEGTVRSHLHHARKRMRELLGDLKEGE